MATESGNSYTISRTSQYFTPGTSFDISLVYDRDIKVVYEKLAVLVASGSITFVIKTQDLQPTQTALNSKIHFSNTDISYYSVTFPITYTFPSGTKFVTVDNVLYLGPLLISPGHELKINIL